jgi:hypothetical protein
MINNQKFIMPNKKSDDSIKYKVLKIWIIIVIIITIIYILYWYINYEIHPVAYYNINRQNFLRNNTSTYPPPLTSFMDPPSVLDGKYVRVENLV